MIAVHQDFRLHNRHQSGFLAQRREERQGLGICLNAGRGGQTVANGDHCAPFREARAESPIHRESLAEPVESLSGLFTGEAGQCDRPFVHLDAGHDALPGEAIRQGHASAGRLANRLIKQDRATDEFAQAGNREQQFAVGPAILLGGRDVESRESFSDGRKALIRGQNAFA